MEDNSVVRIIVAFLISLLIIAILVVTLFYFTGNFGGPSQESIPEPWPIEYVDYDDEFIDESGEESGEVSGEEPEVVEEIYTGPKVFSGESRSVAVMIDNDVVAAWPHAGLNNAYMIYEFIIEGGASRLMAFFKEDNLPEHVGPIRSARHYFLDYVQEHDAIYCHFGWSPLAQSNIAKLGINNINGIYDTYYTRIGPDKTWHNAFSSKEEIEKFIKRKAYRTIQNQDCILSFNEKDVDLESGEIANTVSCRYSTFHETLFEYDEESKNYLISMRNSTNTKNMVPHVDKFTDEQFYTKNILVYKVRDELLNDPENKGRRELYNVGSGEGMYFTNGKMIPIKWSKEFHKSPTKYTDMDGNELKVNDGITWVEIVPKDYGSIVIS